MSPPLTAYTKGDPRVHHVEVEGEMNAFEVRGIFGSTTLLIP
jgi:hypothetical protein